jgi:predicted phage baseplate assembly protein
VWRGLSSGPVATMTAAPARLSIALDVVDPLGNRTPYTPVYDLIGVGPFETDFVPEVTNDGRASIRFGDDTNGRAPADGSFVDVRYRVGRGLAGNVGAESIAHILLPTGSAGLPIDGLRNPLPATGGIDPETIQQIKVAAPIAFRTPQQRAVTEADYAEVAMRYPGIRAAVARFRWTGSWLTVYLILDAVDRDALGQGLADKVKTFVQGYAQTGYDLEVQPASFVPLDIELFVCVAGDRFRTDVEQDLLVALSSGPLPGGGEGFFSPARFGFGQPLYLSALYAAAAAIPGVVSVSASRFSRFYDDDPSPQRPVTAANVAAGVITAGPLEVLELMNDPSLPERGVLQITTGGGR